MRFLCIRLVSAVPTLLIIVTASFFLIHAVPGGPFDQEQRLAPEIKRNLDEAYGLDLPLWRQYGRYLEGLAHLDFGPSFKYKDFTVTELIRQGLPVTIEFGTLALVVALGLGVPIGTLAAIRHRSGIDRAIRLLAFLGASIPTFIVLPVLGLLFGVYLRWLPVAGWEAGSCRDLVLPVIALSLAPLSVVIRMTRGSMLEVLRAPYIRTAHAKGLPLRYVLWRHALRPALLPVAGYLPPAVAAILTGSLVVETIAGLPGIGRYLVQGALNRDYTLVMGMVILYSALLIGTGLLVDLLYLWLDPRIRFRL